MAHLIFLAMVFWISLTGAMSPGAVTAAAISMGARDRFAGTRMALGHALIEIPLMVLLLFGAARLLQLTPVKTAIGLAGGAFLIFMAVGMAKDLRRSGDVDVGFVKGGPLTAGMVLTGGTSSLPGIRRVASEVLGMPVRTAQPENLVGLVDRLNSPAYATSA